MLVFERGERSIHFVLVLEGAIEIFDTNQEGAANVFTVHDARQFTGGMDLFNDRQFLVFGRAKGATHVVRIKCLDFRHLASSETDIGEIIMRALILPRVGLIRHAQGGVVLVGRAMTMTRSGSSVFMTRNGCKQFFHCRSGEQHEPQKQENERLPA